MAPLLLLLLVLFQAGPAHADNVVNWNVMAGVTAAEDSERRAIGQNAERLLLAGQFDELERIADEYRALKETFSDGEWKLSVFYDGMSYCERSASAESWANRIGKLRQWVEKKPQSVTAHVALAESLVGYAFFGRGHGWTKDVSGEQWTLFHERLNEATRVLLSVKDVYPGCPGWLAALMRIVSSARWKREEHEILFRRAIESEPSYNTYYFRKAWILMPTWYGNPGEYDQFAIEAADRIGGTAGDILYARIVWFVDRRDHGRRLSEMPIFVDWVRVKRGLEAIRENNLRRR